MATVVVVPSSAEATAEFFATEWTPYNERAGIEWDAADHYLAARAEDELIGAIYYQVVGGVSDLKHLLVREDYERSGVGSRLIAECERRCRDLGCHKLRLETADYQARAFYERHGFAAVHTFADDRFHHEWYLMEKALRPRAGEVPKT